MCQILQPRYWLGYLETLLVLLSVFSFQYFIVVFYFIVIVPTPVTLPTDGVRFDSTSTCFQLLLSIYFFKNACARGHLTRLLRRGQGFCFEGPSEAPPALSPVRSSAQPLLHWQPVDESHQSESVGPRQRSTHTQQSVRSSAGAPMRGAVCSPPGSRRRPAHAPGARRGCLEAPERSAQRTPGFTEVWQRGARSGGPRLSGAE